LGISYKNVEQDITQNIQERGEKKGIKFHVAAWVTWFDKAEKLEFYNNEEDYTVHPPMPQRNSFYAHNRIVLPKPNSIEVHSANDPFYPESDPQQQAIYKRYQMWIKEQDVGLPAHLRMSQLY
jgi:hypothetical protein